MGPLARPADGRLHRLTEARLASALREAAVDRGAVYLHPHAEETTLEAAMETVHLQPFLAVHWIHQQKIPLLEIRSHQDPLRRLAQSELFVD